MLSWFFNIFSVADFKEFFLKILAAVLVYSAFHCGAIALIKYAPIFFKKLFRLKSENIQQAFVHSFTTPLTWFLRCLGAFFAINIIPFNSVISVTLYAFMSKILRIGRIVVVSVAAQNFVVNIPIFFQNIEEKFSGINKTIVSFFTKLCKALIIAFTAVIILKELGYDVTGLIAGLGLSGLTFALAAQDTASNFVSGMVILIDKPFGVGDWISVGSMEGIVEEMNFRSCRIRTFDNALITVPNSKMSGDSVTNWTKMNMRKTTIKIGLLYSTSKETLQTVCRQISENIKNLDGVKSDSVLVRFDGFSASSLDVVVSYNSFPIPTAEHVILKQKAQYIIMDVVEANDTDFAYDTLTVYNGH